MVLDLVKEFTKKSEIEILNQLNEFCSRGLLIVEQTAPVLVQAENSHQIELRSSIRLKLKDQEYIEKLEKENTELKGLINNIKSDINNINRIDFQK
jgi:hypothetical protein